MQGGDGVSRRDEKKPISALRIEGSTTIFPLRRTQRGFLIGSSDSADIQLPDRTVSRLHAAILRQPDGSLLIVDRASRNHLYIDGVRVARGFLAPQSRIKLGNVILLAVTDETKYAMSPNEARRAFRAAVTSALAQGSLRAAARSLGIATTLLRQLARGVDR